jgi:hypothetical protein
LGHAVAELVAELGCFVAGSVRHFQGNPGEMGWSCGYKNMQMQISHLLERDKVNTALFIPMPSCCMQYVLPFLGWKQPSQ